MPVRRAQGGFMKNRSLLAAAVLLALAGCTSGSGGLRATDGGRALDPVGDPGKVASTEVAFAMAAREDGQWSAFRRFAASDAVVHGADGVVPASAWLAGRNDPPEPVQWAPRAVWSSCDGSLSASFGRFRETDGTVGSYTTIWQLQRGNSYNWTYDLRAPDDPQPPPPPPEAEPDENTIVVTEFDSIEGRVADCARRGAELPGYRQPILDDNVLTDNAVSEDGTLAWRWEHHPDGTRRVVVDYLRGGEWQEVHEMTVAAQSRVGASQ